MADTEDMILPLLRDMRAENAEGFARAEERLRSLKRRLGETGREEESLLGILSARIKLKSAFLARSAAARFTR